MNNQVNLIDADMLLECLKKEAEFCIKEKFNENNTRFYLGRETVLTDIIKQIESGRFALDIIKPGCREEELKEAIDFVMKNEMLYHAVDAHDHFQEILDSLYPKEKERGSDKTNV
ncbi:hypothetical protein AWU65_07245 [Paenibacillus glucanolyticus]|uniref:Uncharacterized protein n=1 Tax=Paenibacillus glucanolyticus TaxID=59843 RepID=A0A163HYZ7_9BACL|nr:hypothetical protein [Paenibacillus glucanolyticus]KZS45722.1 hypothetical protein AWU65_07245 [Paenibacillus glucanolyticus]